MLEDKNLSVRNTDKSTIIAVVIPSYRVKKQIISVIEAIGEYVSLIYVVDDKCPECSGDYVEEYSNDSRVRILRHNENQGVGGAVMTGYRAAVADGADIIVKVDGDGQMDPVLIPYFVQPIIEGTADYTKGNRFYDLEEIRTMPPVRLFGNTILSFMAKFSTGYWDLFDPTNGYTAIHSNIASNLPYEKISRRYFFETDVLFRLNLLRAVVVDVPMSAKYGDEVSNLKIHMIMGEFFIKHVKNTIKRIFYTYYLRDLTLASIELPTGIILFTFGIIYGVYHWIEAAGAKIIQPAGIIMMAALPILMGLQFVLAFLGYDMLSIPRRIRFKTLKRKLK
jgi:dolichol-phosphate mannosyltransferase